MAVRVPSGGDELLGVALLFVLWATCNPYFEINFSGLIYSAYALADLDPDGVGRDSMFTFDGQAAFTLFTPVFSRLARLVGLTTASLLLAAAAVVASFVGAVALARSLFTGRTRVLAVAFAATLPAYYGGYALFAYAEAAATPRPFAEALVFVGLAMLLRARAAWAALAMAVAFVVHPIMALPGILVLAIWLVVGDRRWLAPFAVAGAAGLAAAVLDIQPFDRFFTVIDAAWMSILKMRTPYLFPSIWPDGWTGRASARVATLLIAASLTDGPRRRLLLTTLCAGLLGLGAALACERLPSELLVQAQTWRSMWLVFALATMAGAFCTIELWAGGWASRVTLVLLALSWIYADLGGSMLFALAALAAHVCLRPGHYVLPERVAKIVVYGGALLILVGIAQTEYAAATKIDDAAAALAADAGSALVADWSYIPLTLASAILVIAWRRDVPRHGLVALLAVTAIIPAATWDRRSQASRIFDSEAGVPDLRRLVESRPGEVLWIDGIRESWFWLRRPQWITPIQGAGLVFSRPLAMLYRERSDRAIDAGLADASGLLPYRAAERRIGLDATRIAAFCRASDGPAWIVAPAIADRALAARLKATRWVAPVAKPEPPPSSSAPETWRRISAYDVIPCAGARQALGVKKAAGAKKGADPAGGAS